jgi:hypothetical protein
MNGKKELTALAQKHAPLATAIADGWARILVQDDGDLGLQLPNGDQVSLSAFDEAASFVAKHSAGCAESEVRERWMNAINGHRAEKARGFGPNREPLLSSEYAGF